MKNEVEYQGDYQEYLEQGNKMREIISKQEEYLKFIRQIEEIKKKMTPEEYLKKKNIFDNIQFTPNQLDPFVIMKQFGSNFNDVNFEESEKHKSLI